MGLFSLAYMKMLNVQFHKHCETKKLSLALSYSLQKSNIKVCHITRLFSMPFYSAYGGLQKSHIKVCHITRLFSMSFYPTYGGLVETYSCNRCEMPTDKSYTVLDRHNTLKPNKTLNSSISAGTFVVKSQIT